MTDSSDIIDDAVAARSGPADGSMSIGEFIDALMDDPGLASDSAEYIVRAIEHYGTRTVEEAGEELERYRFFDDPANDGEHAILGHTKTLNDFVDDLRQQAAGTANEEKFFWFVGHTATGKSELKRCLINGIRAFSQTPAGRRYTVEWATSVQHSTNYIDSGPQQQQAQRDDEDWTRSPVQPNPVTVLPESVRETVLQEAGAANATERATVDTDPYSEAVIDALAGEYGRDDDAHESVLSEDHLRVVPYTVDVGNGIGVLQSEDAGQPKQKLVGEWMPGMVQQLGSLGGRDPRAFSYDGVAAQGNSGISIVEDAGQHFELLTKMLNVVDDDVAKIDRRNRLPLDTVFLLLSNPDLEDALYQRTGEDADPLRSLRRRISKYRLDYLVTMSNEVELLHRLLTDQTKVWTDDEHDVREPIEVCDTELAPHTVYAVALFELITRVSGCVVDDGIITRTQLVRLLDGAEISDGSKTYTIDDVDMDSTDVRPSGSGIPVTYTRDVLVDLCESSDEPILPVEALDELADEMEDAAVFAESEADDAAGFVEEAEEIAYEEQEDDVLSAMLSDALPDEEEIETYVEHVYCWGTEEDEVDPDGMTMKVFETEHLGMDEDAYSGTEPGENAADFRDQLVTSITTWFYNNQDESIDDGYPIEELPVLNELLGEHTWIDVDHVYPDFDTSHWADPLEGTETEQVKERTIENMQTEHGYSEESARKTANYVIDNVRDVRSGERDPIEKAIDRAVDNVTIGGEQHGDS